MSAVIDNLRLDHRVTVRRDFTDGAGVTMHAGESGVIRALSYDQIRREVHVEIERAGGKVALLFPRNPKASPCFGNMRELFELGEDVTVPRVLPIHRSPSERTMIIPPPSREESSPNSGPDWWRKALALEAAGGKTLTYPAKDLRFKKVCPLKPTCYTTCHCCYTCYTFELLYL